ncbi:hypothetical protein AB0L25_25190 [Spirillospora sp. NPDC052242]
MEHYWAARGTDIANELRNLSGIVNDYPTGDPFLSISVLAGDAEEAAKSAADHSPVLPVLGAAAIVPYLCWRSLDAALNDRVYASLKAAADALDPLPCPHGDAEHPCDSEQGPDALLYAMEEIAALAEDEPDDPEDAEDAELWACPKNLAELARDAAATMSVMLAEDGPVAQAGEGIYAPELRDEPDVFFDHASGHHDALITRNKRERAIRPKWLLVQLFQILRREPPWDDGPEDDHRGWLMWCARELSRRPDGPASAGLVLALSSVCDYAAEDAVRERVVRDELIEALSEAHRVRRGATCAHDGPHPDLAPEERLVAAARLWDPEHTDKEVEARPVSGATAEAAACPVHVRELALRHAADLRRDVAARFAPPAGEDPFFDTDGKPKIARIARDVRFHLTAGTADATAAAVCARRLLDGVTDPRERAAFVLSVAHAVRYPHWYADVPGALDVLTEALGAVAAADPAECDHTDGHSAEPLETYAPLQIAQLIPLVHDSFGGELTWRHPEQRPFVRPNRYMDKEGPGPDRWRCPVHLAALARLALAEANA